MRELRISAVVVLSLSLTGVDALACGDKFLVVGRGPRAQRVKGAVQKASILMYLDGKTELPEAMKDEGLESELKLAGHRVRQIGARGAVTSELRARRYDIVMAGIADMNSLEVELGALPAGEARPLLLPIVYNPTGDELAAAERRYQCLMRSPSKKQHYLAVIDDAMAVRHKRARAQAEQGR